LNGKTARNSSSQAGDENYQFRSDVLGEMKLPLERIRSME
jgi:hypothetical protein